MTATTLSKLQQIIDDLEAVKPDAAKLDAKSNVAAANRVRKVALQAKKDLDLLRRHVKAEKESIASTKG